MFGIFLMGICGALDEFSSSIGKKQMRDGSESYYTFGFLTQISSALLLACTGLLFQDLVFSLASLPTFLSRVVVAIVELQLAVIATKIADRGTFGITKLATIPLLLGIDLALGYTLRPWQMLGITLVVLPIFVLFFRDKFKTKGFWLVLCVAVLAAVDISLYKYDISHYNSPESETAITALIVSLYFFLTATLIRRENPLQFLKQPIYLAQAASSGFANLFGSFAYLFAPASVITTAFRGFSVLFSILTGKFYFREKGFMTRIMLLIMIVVGLLLLV